MEPVYDVWVVWCWRECGCAHTETKQYRFTTEGERNSFALGVSKTHNHPNQHLQLFTTKAEADAFEAGCKISNQQGA